MIKPIDAWSIDQITSGQVVTSLSSAIKELIENSLDADASVVDIKLHNQGRDGISVLDNGKGIEPEDFPFIARKHATSKLSSFSDLDKVTTLGFRGEALASLCTLANVTVTTNSGSEPTGHELTFDKEGKVVFDQKIPAPRGTLVTISNMFDELPVRRKTFERNSSREFAKTVALVQEYALLSPARITLEHVVKNRSTISLRSQGAKLMQRIACVYGAMRTKSLQPIEYTSKKLCVQLSGLISKPVFGMGDSAPTCQLIAVNSRPTQQPRIKRAIVDMYKQFNLTEQPFFVFDIIMSPELYDVNVSPDKRSLLLHREDELVVEVRAAIEATFNEAVHSVPRASQIITPPPSKRSKQSLLSFASYAGSGAMIAQQTRNSRNSINGSHEDFAENDNTVAEDDAESAHAEETTAFDLSDTGSSGQLLREESAHPPHEHRNRNTESLFPDPVLDAEACEYSRNSLAGSEEESRKKNVEENDGKDDEEDEAQEIENDTEEEFDEEEGVENEVEDEVDAGEDEEDEIEESDEHAHSRCCSSEGPGGHAVHDSPQLQTYSDLSLDNLSPVEAQPAKSRTHSPRPVSQESPLRGGPQEQLEKSKAEHTRRLKTRNADIGLELEISDIQLAMDQVSKSSQKSMKRVQTLAIDEEGVEERLQLSIHKQDFEKMEVVGQFNMGFILVVNRKANHDDLFVVDQHASDEIYNFERLQSSTSLSRQPLVVPQVLELSAVEELTMQEHLEVFENNGFGISFKPENPPGRQCILESVPFSKSTVFDERDVFELLSKLKEEPNQPWLRCSKLRAMFAMRACRSSIMIGRPLSKNTMETVVRHMGTLKKPWNCPHGRPTLRHITSLS